MKTLPASQPFGVCKLAFAVLAVCALLLALPASGSAAVTIGSSLSTPTEAWVCDGGDPTSEPEDFPCVLIQDTINGNPVEGPAGGGVITRWTVRGASGTIALRVLRAIEPYEAGKVKAALRNESVDVRASGGQETFPARQAISQGDYIGIVLQSSSSQAGFSGAPHASPTKLFEGPGALDTTPFATTFSSDGELLFQATVEPDANANGCGDQTQEHLCPAGGGGDGGADAGSGDDSGSGEDPDPPTPDPLAGLRAGQMPGMRILGKAMKVSKKGFVKVTVANPNDFRLKGKLFMKSKKLKVGSKPFSIGAEDSGVVRIKLTKKAFRTLKRKRRMAVMATAKGSGPIGKSRTVRKKLSIKAPPKPKKKKPGGGGGDTNCNPGFGRVKVRDGYYKTDPATGVGIFQPPLYRECAPLAP